VFLSGGGADRPSAASTTMAPGATHSAGSQRKSCRYSPFRRAGCKPALLATTLSADGASLAGARVSLATIGSPARVDSRTASARVSRVSPSAPASPQSRSACNTVCRIPRSTRGGDHRSGPCGRNLSRQKVVIRPSCRSSTRFRRGAGSLPRRFLHRRNNTIRRTGHREPLEAYGTSTGGAELMYNPVDHAAADQRLSTALATAIWAMGEQVADGNRE